MNGEAAETEFRLNRLLSQPLTRLLLRTPLTPNQITLLSLLLGILAGIFFANGTYVHAIFAAFFYQTAVVLDNCDGEVARAKNMKSKLGGWLDVAGDLFTDAAFFVGIAVGMHRRGMEGPILFFAFLSVSGCLLHFFLVILEKTKGFGPAVYQVPHPEHSRRKNFWLTAFDALREGDISWAVVVFAALDKTPWLLWLGALYIQALWISGFLVNFKWTFLKRSSA